MLRPTAWLAFKPEQFLLRLKFHYQDGDRNSQVLRILMSCMAGYNILQIVYHVVYASDIRTCPFPASTDLCDPSLDDFRYIVSINLCQAFPDYLHRGSGRQHRGSGP